MITTSVEWHKVEEEKPEDGTLVLVYRETVNEDEEDSELEFAFATYYADIDEEGNEGFADYRTDEELDFEPELWAEIDFLPVKGEEF